MLIEKFCIRWVEPVVLPHGVVACSFENLKFWADTFSSPGIGPLLPHEFGCKPDRHQFVRPAVNIESRETNLAYFLDVVPLLPVDNESY